MIIFHYDLSIRTTRPSFAGQTSIQECEMQLPRGELCVRDVSVSIWAMITIFSWKGITRPFQNTHRNISTTSGGDVVCSGNLDHKDSEIQLPRGELCIRDVPVLIWAMITIFFWKSITRPFQNATGNISTTSGGDVVCSGSCYCRLWWFSLQ